MCREESHAGSRGPFLVNFCRRFTRALVPSKPYYRRMTINFTRFTCPAVPALLAPWYRLYLARNTALLIEDGEAGVVLQALNHLLELGLGEVLVAVAPLLQATPAARAVGREVRLRAVALAALKRRRRGKERHGRSGRVVGEGRVVPSSG